MLPRSTIRYVLPPVAVALLALAAVAEDVPQESAERATKPARERRPAVAEMDREAIGFARTHHPELADLLERMRNNNPRAYRAAIQDLSRDRARLERLQDRAPERYEFELKLWTMDSRIRLLAARAIRGKADQSRAELQSLMQQRHDFRLNHLRKERDRLATRLGRVEATIEDLERHPPSDADIDALLARIGTRSPAGKLKKNASARPPAESSDDSRSQTELPQD